MTRPPRRGADTGAQPRLVPGLHPVRELLRSGARVDEIVTARDEDSGAVLHDILRLARDAAIPVRQADGDEVDRLAGTSGHQGVLALAPPYAYRSLEELSAAAPAPALLVALDGVTDPHNLGSIARTAEAAGAGGLVVPERRAAGVTPAGEKAAAGALAHLPVARVTNLVRALAQLSARGIWSVGLDGDAPTSLYDLELLVEPVVLVIGSEGRGLSRLVAERCDALAALPMRGRVGSLNASVAAGAALYETLRRRSALPLPQG